MEEWKPDAAKMWREKIAEFRQCGVERVGILSSRMDDCCIEAFEYDQNETTFPIDAVPELPLKNCTCENCMCILVAKADNEITEAQRQEIVEKYKAINRARMNLPNNQK